MRKLMILCLLMAMQFNSFSQTDSVAANVKDVESIDAIIQSLYDVISGGAGETRNWNRMRTLFLPEAKMIATGTNPAGEIVKRVMTVEDYIARSGPVLEKNGFFEKELFRKQEVFGRIAHCFSAYDSRRTLADKAPFMRGINSIQLYNDGKRWWIVSIFWQSESKEVPLPKEYLPH
ncbi:MAG: hypothetical protein K2X48_07895 [Chitinophagaceae bacterium]|nr:hypothetical protein [Chitinophagaceae bacterium]